MSDSADPMQYASGYQLDLYCDTCYGPCNATPDVFTGESFADCARQAKGCGWVIRPKSRTARCPRCKKRKS